MLKIGSLEDYEQVKAGADRFFESSPYKDYPKDLETYETYIKSFLSRDNNKLSVLMYEEDKLIGFIAFEVGTWAFSPVKALIERAMWIEPEYRKADNAKELVGAFEHYAKMLGCGLLQMSSLEGEFVKLLNAFYKSEGYTRVENHYLKKVA